uniref:Uncharacterized protein n=1 Tax=Ananas comosus var. bracteatus TaxID=296719 RepID=A0A6V7P1P5_ANACO|nr:unnamed protein product [Ananas comosus var. bracteatus]
MVLCNPNKAHTNHNRWALTRRDASGAVASDEKTTAAWIHRTHLRACLGWALTGSLAQGRPKPAGTAAGRAARAPSIRLESGGLDNNVEIVQPNTNGEAKQVETNLNGSNSMHLENEKQTGLWKRPRDESVEENCDKELGKCFELVF